MQEDKDKSEEELFYSKTTDKERAVFEGGITLGAIYHQFMGAPFRKKEKLEEAMKDSALSHPHITEAEVRIKKEDVKNQSQFEYPILTENMLEMDLTSEYGDAVAEVKLRYVPEMDYPLMYIEDISTD